jgi:ribosomal protein S27AE
VLVVEETTKAIYDKIERCKADLQTPGNVLYDMYHSKSPKKDAILEWAKNLEILQKRGDYTKPVHEISTTIRTELKDMGLNSAIHYAFEVLPHVYKNPKYTHSNSQDYTDTRVDQPPDDSSILLAEDCKKLNQLTLTRVSNSITALNEFSKRLRTDTTFEMDVPENKMEELLLRWDAINAHLEESLDKREKITPSTHHLLFYAGATETLSNVYSVYVNYVKDFATVTPKQVGKILKGRTKKIAPLYDPKSKHEAMEIGFYGTQCKECGSFRMAQEGSKAKCYKCGYLQKANTEYYDNG